MRRSLLRVTLFAALAVVGVLVFGARLVGAAPGPATARPTDPQPTALQKVAIFAGGCFWCDADGRSRICRASLRRLRLHRRPARESDLRAGLGRRHRARRVGRDRSTIRPRSATRSCSTSSGTTSTPSTPNAQFCDHGTSTARHLLPRRGAAAAGRGVEAGAREVAALRRADRDRRSSPATDVLSGRGVPPELLQEEPGAVQLLPLDCGRDARLQELLGRSGGRRNT